MPQDSTSPKLQGGSSSEPKVRGANRSTKVAGKLKVLPEQPESSALLAPKKLGVELQGPPRDREDSTGTTGDSDEGDIDDDEEEPEEVEVSHDVQLG